MRRIKIQYFTCLIFLLFNSVVYGQIQHENKSHYDLEKHVEDWLSKYSVPSVGIGIIEEGEVRLAKVYTDIEQDSESPNSTVFNVGSLTKPVFAITVLKLVDDQKLGLDETLFKYGIENQIDDKDLHKKLTTRHILSHQTGFPNWRNMTPSKKLAFNFTPGERYAYSGEGYEYLRKIVKIKLNSDIQDFSDSLLFKPLGMNDAKIGSAAGGMHTTIEDYTKFCVHVLNQADLTTELFTKMVTPQVNVKEGIDYGLGWQLAYGLEANEYAIFHSGSEPGFKSFVVLFPKSKNGIVVFTNADNGANLYEEIVRAYSSNGNLLLDRINKRAVPKFIYKIPIDQFVEYTGTYEIGPGMEFTVYTEEDELKTKIPGMPVFNLYAQSEHEFILDEAHKLEFIRNDSNEIDSVIIYQNGIKSYVAKKIK